MDDGHDGDDKMPLTGELLTQTILYQMGQRLMIELCHHCLRMAPFEAVCGSLASLLPESRVHSGNSVDKTMAEPLDLVPQKSGMIGVGSRRSTPGLGEDREDQTCSNAT
jgi:hypothetical protein